MKIRYFLTGLLVAGILCCAVFLPQALFRLGDKSIFNTNHFIESGADAMGYRNKLSLEEKLALLGRAKNSYSVGYTVYQNKVNGSAEGREALFQVCAQEVAKLQTLHILPDFSMEWEKMYQNHDVISYVDLETPSRRMSLSEVVFDGETFTLQLLIDMEEEKIYEVFFSYMEEENFVQWNIPEVATQLKEYLGMTEAKVLTKNKNTGMFLYEMKDRSILFNYVTVYTEGKENILSLTVGGNTMSELGESIPEADGEGGKFSKKSSAYSISGTR